MGGLLLLEVARFTLGYLWLFESSFYWLKSDAMLHWSYLCPPFQCLSPGNSSETWMGTACSLTFFTLHKANSPNCSYQDTGCSPLPILIVFSRYFPVNQCSSKYVKLRGQSRHSEQGFKVRQDHHLLTLSTLLLLMQPQIKFIIMATSWHSWLIVNTALTKPSSYVLLPILASLAGPCAAVCFWNSQPYLKIWQVLCNFSMAQSERSYRGVC